MKEIQLTQGKVALVDDEDFEYLNQWKWHVRDNRNTFYAQRNEYDENGKHLIIHMHRVILNLTDRHIFGDHIDFNGLNNQRYNLRIATRRQNNTNKKSSKNSTSSFLGVSYHKSRNNWRATIFKDYKQIHLGSFKTEIEAAKAYDKHALEIHGEFANLNFNGL